MTANLNKERNTMKNMNIPYPTICFKWLQNSARSIKTAAICELLVVFSWATLIIVSSTDRAVFCLTRIFLISENEMEMMYFFICVIIFG